MTALPSSSADSLPAPGLGRDAWRRFRRDKMAVLGVLVLGAIALSVALGPLLYPLSPTEIDFSNAQAPPSWVHPLGTNDLGQDQLASTSTSPRFAVLMAI